MAQPDDIKQYGAADFERYYSGQMTEQQKHALEKAALDDPFLSDALDGYANTQTAVSDIKELKNKLLQKEHDKKVVWFRPLLRIAAILFLFAGFAWLAYKFNSPGKNEIAAVTDSSILHNNPGVAEHIIADTIKITQPGTYTITSTTAQGSVSTATEPLTLETEKSIKKGSDPGTVTYTWGNRSDSTIAEDSLSSNLAATYYTSTATDSEKEIAKNPAAATPDLKIVKTFKGRIVNSNGLSVANATLTGTKNNYAFTTDKQGTFAFKSADSSPLITVNALGYNSVSRNLTDSMSNNIMLWANTGPSDGFANNNYRELNKRKASNEFIGKYELKGTTVRITVTNAIPVNGWENFNKYVNDSLKTTAQLGKTAVPAEILVFFDVNDKGEPINIKAQKSLCNSCDEEAIRIIKNGPAWKLNNNRKKANAVVKF